MTTDDRPRRPAAATGAAKRSAHAAPGGRILAAGLSASVPVGLVAVIARPRAEDAVLTVTHPQPADAQDTAPATTAPPKMIVPAPPATLAPKPAVSPTTAKPNTKTRASTSLTGSFTRPLPALHGISTNSGGHLHIRFLCSCR